MISDITNKLVTNKNTIKSLMRNIIDDSETRRIMVNVLDKTFNDILDGSMIIKVPKPDKDLIVSRNELAETTKAFTKLLNRFYQIEASEGTMSLMEETKAKQTRLSDKETKLETSRGGGISSPQMTGGAGADPNTQLLLQYLPKFTEKLNTLRDALGQLDLSGGRGGGLAEEIIDEGGDALSGRRRGGDSGAGPGTRGPASRGGPRPSQPAGGGGAGLLKMIALGAAVGLAPKAYEVASNAISEGTNFLSNTITTVAKKAESILASIGQAAGNLIDYGGAALGAGGGEYAAVGAGGQGAWANDAPFIQAVNNVAQKYNIDANDLLGLMQSESGVNPQARNPSGATGLIQFMPNTARGIGTSVEALYGMNRAQQMVWVDRYFAANRLPRGATAGNLYASVFLPKYTSRPPNFVVAKRGGPNDAGDNPSGSWYAQNSGLDLNRDGGITIAELGDRVSKKRQEIGLGPSRAVGGFRAAVNTVTNAATNVGNAAAGVVSEGVAAVTGAGGRLYDMVGSIINLNGGRTGNRRNLQNLDPTFERQLVGALTEYKQRTGRVALMTSGFRYRGDQAHVAANGGMMAAPAGGSRHERGLAMDFNTPDTNAMARLGILARYGLEQPWPRGDAVHVQQKGAATGGSRPAPPGQGRSDSSYYAVAGEDGNMPTNTNIANAFAERLISGLNASVPVAPATPPRLPSVAESTAISKKLNQAPKVVVIDRPVAQPSAPPAIASLGNTQAPPKSSPDLATQYRVYFGVA